MSAVANHRSEVVQLLADQRLQAGEYRCTPATKAEIAGLESRLGLPIPDDLRDWLTMFNGCLAGPAGVYGIRRDVPFLDIESHLHGHASFLSRHILPISNDGCGNYYVLELVAHERQHPVYFTEETESKCVVASGFWQFVRFLLLDELLLQCDDDGYWPFDRERVLREDPDLARYQGGVPFPWDVADIP